ncbi:hypothetical protein QBC44DRAFT_55891 [Cladorrhinum sp. PSN332]|nr:hypothetical protein QBC44DRAFT_55891 [Cladorrhinum sp. PSN332]
MALVSHETQPASTLAAADVGANPANPNSPHTLQVPCSPTSQDSSTSPGDGSFAFGMEKGFWRLEHGARELLRFAILFREHRDSPADGDPSGVRSFPKEIDLISMAQLSDCVRHAVTDIRLHSQKAADDQRLPSSKNRIVKTRSTRPKKRDVSYLDQTAMANPPTDAACEVCFRTETPQWRTDPAGRTLCNVCGLVYAKRCQMYGEG